MVALIILSKLTDALVSIYRRKMPKTTQLLRSLARIDRQKLKSRSSLISQILVRKCTDEYRTINAVLDVSLVIKSDGKCELQSAKNDMEYVREGIMNGKEFLWKVGV